MKKNCLTCNKEMRVKPSNVKRGWGKFCSKSCQYKGNPEMVGGYWTGKKRPNLLNTNAAKTMFKKGQTPHNKGKEFLSKERHWNWKGGKPQCGDCQREVNYGVSYCKNHVMKYVFKNNWIEYKKVYSQRHNWVYKELGRIPECMYCGTDENLEWANISGEYKEDLLDWVRLCQKCHRNFDLPRMLIKGGGAHENV